MYLEEYSDGRKIRISSTFLRKELSERNIERGMIESEALLRNAWNSFKLIGPGPIEKSSRNIGSL